MKRSIILYLVTGVALFTACTKTPEEKAEVLIKKSLKYKLMLSESYAPMETTIDSAFAPFDDPVFYARTMEWCSLAITMDELEKKEKKALSSMAMWEGDHQSAYGKARYEEEKAKHDAILAQMEDVIKQGAEKYAKLVEESKGERRFIGFVIRHHYSARNIMYNKTEFGAYEYIVDNDIKNVIAEYDMNGNEYKIVHQVYDKLVSGDGWTEE